MTIPWRERIPEGTASRVPAPKVSLEHPALERRLRAFPVGVAPVFDLADRVADFDHSVVGGGAVDEGRAKAGWV